MAVFSKSTIADSDEFLSKKNIPTAYSPKAGKVISFSVLFKIIIKWLIIFIDEKERLTWEHL